MVTAPERMLAQDHDMDGVVDLPRLRDHQHEAMGRRSAGRMVGEIDEAPSRAGAGLMCLVLQFLRAAIIGSMASPLLGLQGI